MKKISIGVMTFYHNNYGAFLQAFALQKTLEKLGYHAEVIDYNCSNEKAILGIPVIFAKRPVFFIKRLLVEIIMYKKHKQRTETLKKSIKQNLRESSRFYSSYKQLCENPPCYDIYLTGSDQVFNHNLEPQSFDSRLLRFTNRPKVSFAASVGSVENLNGVENTVIRALSEFKVLSVREENFGEYLSLKLNRKVEVNVDPTLLFDMKQWGAFAKKPSYLKGKYIFYYRVLPQEKLREEAERISDILNIPVFVADGNVKFKNQIEREDFLAPEEWVGALLNAEYVVTNSFHGTAFSVNFRKKAFVLLPPSGGARIQNLIEQNGLSRLYDNQIIYDDEIDELYARSRYFIETERNKAVCFLDNLKHII